jgi:type I site-specific restriction-modification system R (restriction) subunit
VNKDQLYGNFKKVVQFSDDAKRHADLRLRLHYDGIRQGEFFRALVIGYLERDPDLMKFVESLKEKVERYSNSKRNKIKKQDRERNKVKDKFKLNPEEVEDIFDMISKEHIDL